MDVIDVDAERVHNFTIEEINNLVENCFTKEEFAQLSLNDKIKYRILCTVYMRDHSYVQKYTLREFLLRKTPEQEKLYPNITGSPKEYPDPEKFDIDFWHSYSDSDSVSGEPKRQRKSHKLTLEEMWDASDEEHKLEREVRRERALLAAKRRPARGQGVKKKKAPPKKRGRKRKAPAKPTLKPPGKPRRKRKVTTEAKPSACRAKNAPVTRSQAAAAKKAQTNDAAQKDQENDDSQKAQENDDTQEDQENDAAPKTGIKDVLQKTEAKGAVQGTAAKKAPKKTEATTAGKKSKAKKAATKVVPQKSEAKDVAQQNEAKEIVRKTPAKITTQKTEIKAAGKKATKRAAETAEAATVAEETDITETTDTKGTTQEAEVKDVTDDDEAKNDPPAKKRKIPRRRFIPPPPPPCFYNKPSYEENTNYIDYSVPPLPNPSFRDVYYPPFNTCQCTCPPTGPRFPPGIVDLTEPSTSSVFVNRRLEPPPPRHLAPQPRPHIPILPPPLAPLSHNRPICAKPSACDKLLISSGPSTSTDPSTSTAPSTSTGPSTSVKPLTNADSTTNNELGTSTIQLSPQPLSYNVRPLKSKNLNQKGDQTTFNYVPKSEQSVNSASIISPGFYVPRVKEELPSQPSSSKNVTIDRTLLVEGNRKPQTSVGLYVSSIEDPSKVKLSSSASLSQISESNPTGQLPTSTFYVKQIAKNDSNSVTAGNKIEANTLNIPVPTITSAPIIITEREKRIQPKRINRKKFIVTPKSHTIVISNKGTKPQRSRPFQDITKYLANRQNILEAQEKGILTVVSRPIGSLSADKQGQEKRSAEIKLLETKSLDTGSSAEVMPSVKKPVIKSVVPSEKPQIRVPPHVKPCPTHGTTSTIQTKPLLTIATREKRELIVRSQIEPTTTASSEVFVSSSDSKILTLQQPQAVPSLTKTPALGNIEPVPIQGTYAQKHVRTYHGPGKKEKFSPFETDIFQAEVESIEVQVIQEPVSQVLAVQSPVLLKTPVTKLPASHPGVIQAPQHSTHIKRPILHMPATQPLSIQSPIVRIPVTPTQMIKQPSNVYSVKPIKNQAPDKAIVKIGERNDLQPDSSSNSSDEQQEVITIQFPPNVDQSQIQALSSAQQIQPEAVQYTTKVVSREQVQRNLIQKLLPGKLIKVPRPQVNKIDSNPQMQINTNTIRKVQTPVMSYISKVTEQTQPKNIKAPCLSQIQTKTVLPKSALTLTSSSQIRPTAKTGYIPSSSESQGCAIDAQTQVNLLSKAASTAQNQIQIATDEVKIPQTPGTSSLKNLTVTIPSEGKSYPSITVPTLGRSTSYITTAMSQSHINSYLAKTIQSMTKSTNSTNRTQMKTCPLKIEQTPDTTTSNISSFVSQSQNKTSLAKTEPTQCKVTSNISTITSQSQIKTTVSTKVEQNTSPTIQTKEINSISAKAEPVAGVAPATFHIKRVPGLQVQKKSESQVRAIHGPEETIQELTQLQQVASTNQEQHERTNQNIWADIEQKDVKQSSATEKATVIRRKGAPILPTKKIVNPSDALFQASTSAVTTQGSSQTIPFLSAKKVANLQRLLAEVHTNCMANKAKEKALAEKAITEEDSRESVSTIEAVPTAGSKLSTKSTNQVQNLKERIEKSAVSTQTRTVVAQRPGTSTHTMEDIRETVSTIETTPAVKRKLSTTSTNQVQNLKREVEKSSVLAQTHILVTSTPGTSTNSVEDSREAILTIENAPAVKGKLSTTSTNQILSLERGIERSAVLPQSRTFVASTTGTFTNSITKPSKNIKILSPICTSTGEFQSNSSVLEGGSHFTQSGTTKISLIQPGLYQVVRTTATSSSEPRLYTADEMLAAEVLSSDLTNSIRRLTYKKVQTTTTLAIYTSVLAITQLSTATATTASTGTATTPATSMVTTSREAEEKTPEVEETPKFDKDMIGK